MYLLFYKQHFSCIVHTNIGGKPLSNAKNLQYEISLNYIMSTLSYLESIQLSTRLQLLALMI